MIIIIIIVTTTTSSSACKTTPSPTMFYSIAIKLCEIQKALPKLFSMTTYFYLHASVSMVSLITILLIVDSTVVP